jgi:hypothetical protein
MQDKNTPAFPFVAEDDTGMMINMGMTLRDYFAAKAMQALIHVQVKTKQQQTAAAAYEWADEMLKAREL